MTSPSGLRLIDEPAVEPRPEPKVLVRTIPVPAGLPWDQDRAARLEARHSAPLPMQELVHRLQRLDPWRPSTAGRYVAFYVLARELTGRLDTTVEVDGRVVRVSFLTPAQQGERARRLLAAGVVAGAIAFLATATIGVAFTKRLQAEAALSALETRTAGKLHLLAARDQLKVQNRTLDAQPDRGARTRDVLADIAWAASGKAPDAHIEALHWEPGLMAVEVRGAEAPFAATTDRLIQKSAKPIRRGVWLWGVTPRSFASGGRGPVAAMPRDLPMGSRP